MGSLAVSSSGRPEVLSTETNGRHDTHASLKPTNPPESALKRLNEEIVKITSLRRGSIRGIITTLSHDNLAHKPIPTRQASRITDAKKAAVGSEWVKLKTLPAWRETQVKGNRWSLGKRNKKPRTVHCPTLMELCHL